jgi:hypothetical protein
MGEGFIVRRGGGGQQTVKPIFNSLTSATFTSLTLNVTNDDNSIAVLYYSVVQTEPGPTTPDTFETEFAGKETKDITITGLTSGTTYTVYIKAYAVGAFPSETVIVTELTTNTPIVATGGTITNYSDNSINYKIHRFNSNGTFQVSSIPQFTDAQEDEIEILVIGGGGSGGSTGGGGGGAGGLVYAKRLAQIQSYSIVVGAGGGRATGWSSGLGGVNGQNSTAFGLTARGGGHGGDHGSYSKSNGSVVAKAGGSGGGGRTTSGGATNQSSLNSNFIFNLGNAGGNGTGQNGHRQGGGGGAGGPGLRGEGTGTTSSFPGHGGPGFNMSPYFGTGFGVNGFFAGGGGTGWYQASGANNNTVGVGGTGGGGRGGFTNAFNSAMDGVPNTGSGGGGGGYASAADNTVNSGQGGSGIVLIKYRIN